MSIKQTLFKKIVGEEVFTIYPINRIEDVINLSNTLESIQSSLNNTASKDHSHTDYISKYKKEISSLDDITESGIYSTGWNCSFMPSNDPFIIFAMQEGWGINIIAVSHLNKIWTCSRYGDNSSGELVYYWRDWTDISNASTLGGKSADEFYNKTPTSIDVSTNPTTLSSGIYSVEGALSKANGYPLDASWTHGLIYVSGEGTSDYGYRVIRFESIYNDHYIKFQQWGSWSDWISLRDATTLGGKDLSYFEPHKSYAPIYEGNILDISEMGAYSCYDENCTNLPQSGTENPIWWYVWVTRFRDSGYKLFYATPLNFRDSNSNMYYASEYGGVSTLTWKKINDGGNAATLGGHSASYFQPAMFQTIDDLLNANAKTIYLCNDAKNAPHKYGLTSAGVGICICSYCNTSYITLVYIPSGVSDMFIANINSSSTSISWKKINDGGNADTVDGKHASAFAPSGFGLGTACTYLSASTDLNSLSGTGFFMGANLINNPANDNGTSSIAYGYGSTNWWYIIQLVHNDKYKRQIAYTLINTANAYKYNQYTRFCDSGTWSKWSIIGNATNADTVDNKHATAFYPQGTVYGTSLEDDDTPISVINGYNNIIGGNISDIINGKTLWGMNISKESDSDSGYGPSLFVAEGGTEVFSYQQHSGSAGNASNDRRTLSVGAAATVVVAASNTYPESVKFSADLICDGTDDSLGIQSAINQLTKGGKILLLNGTYSIATPIEIKYDNISIEGVGNSTILLQQSSTFGLFKTTKTINGLTLKNFRINGVQSMDTLIFISSNLNYCNIEGIFYYYDSDIESDFTLVGRSGTDTKSALIYSTVTNCILVPNYDVYVNMSYSLFTSNVVSGTVNLSGSYNTITGNRAYISISGTNTGNVVANNNS